MTGVLGVLLDRDGAVDGVSLVDRERFLQIEHHLLPVGRSLERTGRKGQRALFSEGEESVEPTGHGMHSVFLGDLEAVLVGELELLDGDCLEVDV